MTAKSSKKNKETPLMRQYYQIKAQYPGALLLFRVGDFYETFGEDASIISKLLDIVLTKRSNGAAGDVPLAGFPYHALDTHMPKLVRAGHRVAICDQLEAPQAGKSIVKRGVTELVTPGVSFHDQVLDGKSSNYLAAVHFQQDNMGIALLEVSTGEFMTAQGKLPYIEKLLQSFQPSEVIFSRDNKKVFQSHFGDQYHRFLQEEWVYQYDYAYEKLTQHFKASSLKGFGIDHLSMGIVAAGAILRYLEETEHHHLQHIASIHRIEEDQYVSLDKFTIRNLELIRGQHEDSIPLIKVIDQTVTPMGARLLQKWFMLPRKEMQVIQDRLNAVEVLVNDTLLSENLLHEMSSIGDLERLISKVATQRANPRELFALMKSLKQLPVVKNTINESNAASLKSIADSLLPCDTLQQKIEQTLHENPPVTCNQGKMIRDGVNAELDELRKIAYSGKDHLKNIVEREREKTGITSLKIAYNKVFGYYLEVTHAHKDKVPEEWIRKQTLVNAERYITPELKAYEEKILGAEEKIYSLEFQLYQTLLQEALVEVVKVQKNARVIAQLDCLVSMARIAIKNQYCKPIINEGKVIDIKAGRHPVIETQLPLGEKYVPNDIYLNSESDQILIITGPNMAGKSAVLRQTALIVLLAQMGSYVPADSVTIGLVDQVFTRVGASDNLAKGESTFMVEMTETASIMHNLSDKSLVLMDEIGRGTSTYDGIAIAWALVEHLHSPAGLGAKTLFATHYHELNQLADTLDRVKNFSVEVKEIGNKIVFLHKLKEGGSEHSFGIHVAQMAGMPQPIVKRANEIMLHLAEDRAHQAHEEKINTIPEKSDYQLTLFGASPELEKLKAQLEKIDVQSTTPVEALLKLSELKILVSKSNE